MRVFNPLISAMIVAVAWTGTGAIQAAAKPKVSAAQKQLQAQLQAVTAERDDLKDRLAATESLQGTWPPVRRAGTWPARRRTASARSWSR